MAPLHADRRTDHAVAFAVFDQRRGAVKSHGLGVEHGAEVRGGIVAAQIGRGVGDERETGGVAFGETVFAEAANLFEDPFGKFLRDALRDHPRDEALPVPFDAAGLAPRGHVAAELIGLAGRVIGGDDGELHDLFLKQRNAEGLLQHRFQRRVRVVDDFFAVAPPQVGVHHAAGDGAGPHDADFDDEVVVVARPQTRQHGHLRAAFDLKHAGRVALADHFESRFILRRNGGEGQRFARDAFR